MLVLELQTYHVLLNMANLCNMVFNLYINICFSFSGKPSQHAFRMKPLKIIQLMKLFTFSNAGKVIIYALHYTFINKTGHYFYETH